jgi:prepilin-type N-terminal cleavage/methylation domain-containing protein
MKTNKGYSLAELLVSIAIFSVVMVSIIAVMRNASVTYRNENAEVQLQENCQMLLSQVDELLCDAKSVSYIGTKTWSIVDNDNISHVLRFSGNSVQYKYGSSGYEDLCTNVKDFDITGLQADHGDDKCYVRVKMLNNVDGTTGGRDYTYEADKVVTFRNASVEKSDAHDGSFLTGSSTTPTPAPSPGTINVKMGRYELLNLISDYDFDVSKPITLTGDTTAYNFVNTSGLNSSNYMASITKLTSGTTSGYLTTSDVCESTTNTSYHCTVKGTTNANKDITLNITTPAVKLKKGVGIVYLPINAINNGEGKNYYSFVEIEGLNVKDLKKYHPTATCTGKLEFSISGNGSAFTGNIIPCTSNWDNKWFGELKCHNDSGMQCNVGLGYDEYSTDVLGVLFNGKLFEPGDTGKHTNFNNKKYTVKISVTYPSQGGTATTSETYKVYTSGANLKDL